ncbi:hypothetical protein ANN_26653 [Periplaneta americana]|uniref:Uncharacterized protein n=1 Tax=Periplaneta americana TaxID=6978 RepID=A0ABQ8RYP0_PERAM|nr:hypothetical protein ANN_26653 [Periplaneta americana]
MCTSKIMATSHFVYQSVFTPVLHETRHGSYHLQVTGHGKMKSYQHRFHVADDSTCSCNTGQQTVHHIIYECPEMRQQRIQLREEIRKKGGNWPVTTHEVVSKNSVIQ